MVTELVYFHIKPFKTHVVKFQMLCCSCFTASNSQLFFFLSLPSLASREAEPDKAEISKPTCPVVDVGVVRYTANDILPQNVQAKSEESEMAQKLIPSLSDVEIEEVNTSLLSRWHIYERYRAFQHLICTNASSVRLISGLSRSLRNVLTS